MKIEIPGVQRELPDLWRAESLAAVAARRLRCRLARTVARLMRMMGLQGIIRGKPVKTTVPDKSAQCPLDRVNRQFFAPAPNMLWLSDFTYVATWQGFVYVAFVIDAFARRIVGGRASRTAMRALCSMLSTRRCMIGGPFTAAGWFTIPTAARNMCPFAIPSGWRKQASSLPPEVLATVMTTLSPKRTTVITRPRSSTGEDHGATSRPWSSPRSNGSIGCLIACPSSSLFDSKL